MKRRTWLLSALFILLWPAPAKADNRIIVRTTLGLQGLQQLCLLQSCTVVGGLGDVQNQLFLLTTPLDPTTFLGILRSLPGIVNAELDQLISLLAGHRQPAKCRDPGPAVGRNSGSKRQVRRLWSRHHGDGRHSLGRSEGESAAA